MERCRRPTFDLSELVGADICEATRRLRVEGFDVEVMGSGPVTTDYLPNRISLSEEGGFVVDATIG